MKGEIAAATDLIREGSHLIAEFDDRPAGPTLIVVGGIHGNEPSGVKALLNVARRLAPLRSELNGRVYFLAGNTRALRQNLRFIDSDLNRHWVPDNLSKTAGGLAEDTELIELKRILDHVFATAGDEVFVLDLHTTSAAGKPFATLGDTLRNRHFAKRFPITVLLGIEEQLKGTLLEFLNNRGAVTLGFEGGRHASDEAVANHEALVWLGLVNSSVLPPDKVPDLDDHFKTLRSSTGTPSIVEVRFRQPVGPEEEFKMDPGYNNFDPIKKGQVLASNRFGPIRAVEGGLVLMPLYQSLGEDGFFIGRKIAPFWIFLSEVLRRLRAASVMPLLPGVRRHPDDPESLIIDTRVARFFPLQIFHLLGFRRRRWTADTLVVSRRRFDTQSPFVKQK
jgi:succinylglutamate desuccinylase